MQAPDLVAYLCRIAKEALNNRKIVGSYYGYCFHIASYRYSTTLAQYALKKLIDSKSVDFLMSPQSYWLRNLGDTTGDMKPFKTLENNGMMSVIEDDTRTHNMKNLNGRYYQSCNIAQTIDIMRRNMGVDLVRNQPVYLAAMQGTEFDFPEFTEDVASARKTGEFCAQNEIARHAEIAVIVSEESPKYLAYEKREVKNGKKIQTYAGDGKARAYEHSSIRLTGELVKGQPFHFGAYRRAC